MKRIENLLDGIRSLFSNLKCLILNEPPNYVQTVGELIGQERIQISGEIITALKKKDSRPIFIIGAWGSGKTLQIRSLDSKFKKEYHYLYRSFFSISNIRAAYLHLLPHSLRIVLMFLTVTVFSLIWVTLQIKFPNLANYKNLGLLLLSSVAFFLITNRMKLFYAGACLIQALIPTKPHLTIIDDLERSSMPSEEIWALLSNLWVHRHKYIVLFGYNSEIERLDILEKAIKLEGQIINLPADYHTNFKIAKKLDPSFPIAQAQWFEKLTPRNIIQIFITVDRESKYHQNPIYRELIYINQYFQMLMSQLNVTQNLSTEIRFGIGSSPHKNLRIIINRHSGYNNPLPTYVDTYVHQIIGSLPEKARTALAEQTESTVNEFFKSTNLFELRRLFSSFSGLNQ